MTDQSFHENDNTSNPISAKNLALAVFLAFVFGSLGLLYASIIGGAILSVVIFLLLTAATANVSSELLWLVIAILWWVVSPLWAWMAWHHATQQRK